MFRGACARIAGKIRIGKRQSRIEVVATDVTFLDGPANDNSSSTTSAAPKNSKREEAVTEIDDKPIDLSEIPF